MKTFINNVKKYVDLRDSMNTGDVIAFKGTDFGAKAILAGTNSNYSHVGLVVRLKSISVKRIFIVEAIPAGVILQALSLKIAYYPGNVWWAPLKVDAGSTGTISVVDEDKKRNKILDWAMLQLGRQYDTDLIKGIVKKIFLKTKLPKDSQYAFICSELVATALKKAGFIEKDRKTGLTPKQIMQLKCLKRPIKLV